MQKKIKYYMATTNKKDMDNFLNDELYMHLSESGPGRFEQIGDVYHVPDFSSIESSLASIKYDMDNMPVVRVDKCEGIIRDLVALNKKIRALQRDLDEPRIALVHGDNKDRKEWSLLKLLSEDIDYYMDNLEFDPTLHSSWWDDIPENQVKRASHVQRALQYFQQEHDALSREVQRRCNEKLNRRDLAELKRFVVGVLR